MGVSDLEALLDFQLKAMNIPAPEKEYRFAPPRRWRFDRAWPDVKIAAEINGGTWIQGRHNRGSSIKAEYDKLNAAALAGWRVFLFTAEHIKGGQAVAWIGLALNLRSAGFRYGQMEK